MNPVINLNKPKDISSQQAVTKVKQLFGARKAGHAGTLDPMATGVLIVCLNEATKIARFLSDLDKEYIVRLKLGERTDTYDSTGAIIDKRDVRLIDEKEIYEILERFTGSIRQTPPMYSAIKVGGKPLYKLARKGIHIERAERMISIQSIRLLQFDLPFITLKVSCSKGTYIRTLCDDIGNALGTGAHMVFLERSRIGFFCIENSASFEDILFKKSAHHSMDAALSHLDEIILTEDDFRRAKNGMPIYTAYPSISAFNSGGIAAVEKVPKSQYVRLKDPENILFGIGKIEDKVIKIERLLN